MLTSKDYETINRFKDMIHRYHFMDSQYDAFRKLVCVALEQFFDHHSSIFGFLNYPKAHETSLNILMHNLSDEFVQKFYLSGILNEPALLHGQDVVAYSSLSNYKKRRLSRELLADHRFVDFLICFLPLDDNYIGFLILFRDKEQKPYSERDIETMAAIKDYLAVEYLNFMKIVQLRNSNRLLMSQANFYPMGVVILQDFLTVSYMNDVAKEYMEELEITSAQFFSVFLNNHIIPAIKNDLLRLGRKQIVRYKNFIFSIATSDPVSKDFLGADAAGTIGELSLQEALATNLTTYVYIWRDELSVYSKSKGFFNELNLTKREKEIAELILQGNDAQQISAELGISVNTVKVHIQKLYRKTGSSSLSEFLFFMRSRSVVPS